MRYLFIILLLIAGCQITNPGGQTQTALRQDTRFAWGDKDNPYGFAAGLVGSQTGAFEMFEGGDIVRREDGSIDWENSRTQCYLRYSPKADAAASALDRAYSESSRQMDRLSGMLENMFTMFMLQRMIPREDNVGTTARSWWDSLTPEQRDYYERLWGEHIQPQKGDQDGSRSPTRRSLYRDGLDSPRSEARVLGDRI